MTLGALESAHDTKRIPPATLDSFIAEGWAAWTSFGFTFAGWLLAAIVVAGLSGVFKRD
jgi:hypothetical protein